MTQNVDGYHAELLRQARNLAHRPVADFAGGPLFGITEGVYEIHGNTHYMRCSLDGCSDTGLYKTPEVYNEGEIPRCKTCGNVMRRNVLMFDESYNEKYYRSHTVLNKAREADLLLVVGTELKTNLPKRIVEAHIERGVPIIEFNLRRWVDNHDKLITVEGPCEKTLPAFVDKYILEHNKL